MKNEKRKNVEKFLLIIKSNCDIIEKDRIVRFAMNRAKKSIFFPVGGGEDGKDSIPSVINRILRYYD